MTEVATATQQSKTEDHHKHFNIIVEVDGKNVHIEFDGSPVTGQAIREKAGAPLSDDLVRLEHGKPVGGNIGLHDKVDLKEGEHFQALPTGTAS
jgi:hypothetical protein